MRRSLSAALLVLALGATVEARAIPQQTGTHTVRDGDTLWRLAQDYLGNPFPRPVTMRVQR